MAQIEIGAVKVEIDPRFSLSSLVLVAQEAIPSDPVAAGAGSYRPSFVITTSGQPVPEDRLRAYVIEQVSLLRQFPKFKQLAQEEGHNDHGAKVIWQRHTFRDRNQVTLEQLQLYVAQGGQVVVGTATHLEGKPFAELEPTFRQMLRSIRPG